MIKKLFTAIICFLIAVSPLTFSVSASDVEPDYSTVTSPDSVNDLLDFGFVDLGWDTYGLPADYDFSFMGTSPDSNYTVKYPDFDINKIDLSSFPDEVYEIVKDTNSTILVYVQSVTAVDIFVARNCYLATTDGYGYTHLFFYNNPSVTNYNYFLDHACYKARYKWGKTADVYTLSSYWSEPSTKLLGSEGATNWSYYTTASKPTFVGDFYAFNVNANAWKDPSDYSSFIISNSSGSLTATGYTGPLDEKYTKFNTYYHSNGYDIRMIPGADFPTHEKQQASTQKGIWGSIKELIGKVTDLPGNIASGISGFFTSLGDRISSFFETLKTKLQNLLQNEEGKSFFTVLGDRISGFFTSIGDRISGFFTDSFNWLGDLLGYITNMLLWFNVDGEESYENPFSDLLVDLKSFFNTQINNTNDFKDSSLTNIDSLSTQLSSVSSVISSITNIPVLSSAVYGLLAFFVIRKVVGQ